MKMKHEDIVQLLNEIDNNSLVKLVWENLFDYPFDEAINLLHQIDSEYQKEENKKEEQSKAKHIEIQKQKPVVKLESKPTTEFVRPSSKLSTNTGLQIHKLVQEYIDTMIKPYVNDNVDNNTINDAYAGLYEFAAWILTKNN